MKILDTLRALARSILPGRLGAQGVQPLALKEALDEESTLLAALDAQSLPAPWSLRGGATLSESWIGLQNEAERLDVARCVLESIHVVRAAPSDIYLRHATTLVVRESEGRGGVSDRQYLIGVAASTVRQLE